VLFSPNAGAWSFPSEAAPVFWNLPVGSRAGNITLVATTSGSTPINGDGVVFTVRFDGLIVYTSACMTNGGDMVAVPPGTLTIQVTFVRGCNGGPDTTNPTVSGAGA
jgi:hypothetical protein